VPEPMPHATPPAISNKTVRASAFMVLLPRLRLLDATRARDPSR
jgi:hypothetical protein